MGGLSAGAGARGAGTAPVDVPGVAAEEAGASAVMVKAEGVGGREEAGRIVMIPVGAIAPNRFQPRRRFDEASLLELAASIRSAGVVQPVLVRRASKQEDVGGERYELVAGERRWRASKLAGLASIPAVVAALSDEQAAEWALIENVQRADLQPMEQAHALKQLCETFGHTHARAAEKLGLDRTTVTNLLRLTELEPEVQALLEAGKLTGAHAKVLLGMMGGAKRVEVARLAAEEEWSVRELTVSVIASAKTGAAPARGAAGKAGRGAKSAAAGVGLAAAGLEDLQRQLSEHLGTKVQIRVKRGGKSGDVVVRFYDLDHFDGLMGKMGFVMR
ncbi:MAG: ParB/RepB/Spo0J family partition protein [Phycisphaerales bacterium]